MNFITLILYSFKKDEENQPHFLIMTINIHILRSKDLIEMKAKISHGNTCCFYFKGKRRVYL